MVGDSSRPMLLKLVWVLSLALPAAAQVGLSRVWPKWGVSESPTVLFVVVVIGAALCAITALMVLARAERTNEAELGYLGLAFLALSVLPLVHGLTTPGVLYADNDATMSAAFWSIPIAVAAASPTLLQRSPLGVRIDLQWRRWVRFGRIAIMTLAASLLIWTSLLPAPDVGSNWTSGVAYGSFVACALLSMRQLTLAIIARSKAPLVVAAGYGLVGSSAFVWLGAAPFSVGFWIAHVLDITGVLLGTVGALYAFRRTASVARVLEPVLVVDPRSALELGLEPIVHAFVSELQDKDPITRDHVVRTTELAMATGRSLGLDGEALRQLGLTALLHDIGKLKIPDAVLNKPDKLTDAEYAIVKRHADYGADLVMDSKPLAAIAPWIRAHHERIDGGGYPKGLIGSQIPLIARIVSVCDAFDAMANTRQYREGLTTARAIEILEQHAGAQWDRRVVEAVVRIVRAQPPSQIPQYLDAVGRVGCDCVPDAFANAA